MRDCNWNERIHAKMWYFSGSAPIAVYTINTLIICAVNELLFTFTCTKGWTRRYSAQQPVMSLSPSVFGGCITHTLDFWLGSEIKMTNQPNSHKFNTFYFWLSIVHAVNERESCDCFAQVCICICTALSPVRSAAIHLVSFAKSVSCQRCQKYSAIFRLTANIFP